MILLYRKQISETKNLKYTDTMLFNNSIKLQTPVIYKGESG
jgi:hypothetical protein